MASVQLRSRRDRSGLVSPGRQPERGREPHLPPQPQRTRPPLPERRPHPTSPPRAERAKSGPTIQRRASAGVGGNRQVALIDLLDRLLQGGVAIQGEITLSAAGIDLVAVDLWVLVAAVDKVAGR